MKISEYVEKYTESNEIRFVDFLEEVREFFVEVLKFRKDNIAEEFSDAVLFFQAWLWSQFKIDGELWNGAKNQLKNSQIEKLFGRKFMNLPA